MAEKGLREEKEFQENTVTLPGRERERGGEWEIGRNTAQHPVERYDLVEQFRGKF